MNPSDPPDDDEELVPSAPEPGEEFRLTGVARLSRDLVMAAITMGDREARYLVDTYYMAQEYRKRAASQERAIVKRPVSNEQEPPEPPEPHEVLTWVKQQNYTLERQIHRALSRFIQGRLITPWCISQYGIGPVITAGLIAHIDIKQAITVSHIWSFAGLNPTAKWETGQPRPWNASLKTLTWKIGQSFMKFSGKPDCHYGHLYRERKELELLRNNRGDHTELAAQLLKEKNWDKRKDAYQHLKSGHLPPSQVDGRARRFVVKLFLSHLQLVWWYIDRGELPPKPYAIQHGGHADFMAPPNTHLVAGLDEALRRY